MEYKLLILTLLISIMIKLISSENIKYKDCNSNDWIGFLSINCKNNNGLKNNKKDISKFCNHLENCYSEYGSYNNVSIHVHEACANSNNLNIFNIHIKKACNIAKKQVLCNVIIAFLRKRGLFYVTQNYKTSCLKKFHN